jgi:[acyl-carrier-protein] S-malonyltransferase
MGSGLLAAEPGLLEHYLAQAEAAAGLPIRRYCLEGPLESLTRTEVVQPALLAVSLALTDAARARGLSPDAVAGHSLGEYTAAVVAGALSVEDGIELVALRGRLMAEIQSERPGAMAAVIGLSAEQVQELCDRASADGAVSLANLNAPTQVVVSGEEAAVSRVAELAQEHGAQRVVRLLVGAGFHSPLMAPVQERMAEAASALAWSDPRTPLASCYSGEVVLTGEALRDALIAETTSPVDWVACVRTLVASGCKTFLELGPGRALAGLIRQIDPTVDVFAADSSARLDEFARQRPELVAAT